MNKKGVDLNRKGLEGLKGVVNRYFFHIRHLLMFLISENIIFL